MLKEPAGWRISGLIRILGSLPCACSGTSGVATRTSRIRAAAASISGRPGLANGCGTAPFSMCAAGLRLLALPVTIPAVATLILTQAQIRTLLPMRLCMDLMCEALATLARGQAQNPLRWVMKLSDGKGLLGLMPGSLGLPGSLGSPAAFGLKVVAIFPGNHGTTYDSHQGVVVLFDAEHGVPRAILDASEVTAIRTAAVSAVATRQIGRAHV